MNTDVGFAFTLTDEAFQRWVTATVLPEDMTEFVHLLHGGLDEARFVCAVDYITNVEGGEMGADATLRAYQLARNEPIDYNDAQGRINAHYLSQCDSTRFLLDRVRNRSRRIAEERIANRAITKIEELFNRSAELDGKERLETERAALEVSMKFLANQARERGQESERRAKKAAQDAITRSRQGEGDMKRLPSLAEAKLHLAMLIDGHGAESVAELVRELSPRALDAPSDQR